MLANETKLQVALEGTKQFVVPLFQRSYSWEPKEWGRLWDDLMELYETENPRTHFIGSIVTMPTVSVPEGVAKFLLIDGQQRLTTIFILLSLLRDKAKENGKKEFSEEISNTLLVNQYKKDSDHYKLQPTQIDRSCFQSLMISKNVPPESQIAKAYNFFEKKMKMKNIDEEKLNKVIISNLSIVSIVLDANDNPYLVFESLNAKGKPLSQADLIRNYFFMRIHIDQQESIYYGYWKPMEDDFGETLTEFIRHYIMKNGTIIRQNDVYFSLKEHISRSDALECLKDLALYAGYYLRIINPAKESNTGIRQALMRLSQLQVTTIYPFLLNCYHDYDQGKLQPDEFIQVLDVIENFIIRRFICNVPTNQLSKIFSPLYLQIQNNNSGSVIDSVKFLLQNKGYPKDIEFKERLKDSKLYGAGDRLTKTKLILQAMEESYSHREQAPFDNLTIEHVMPQKLCDEWKEHLGEDWEKTHELLLHTIGNLTLTAYNTELSNEGFESKRNRLGESHLELNKYFKDKVSWKKEDIERRSDDLANIAVKIWPYFGNESNELLAKDDVTGTTPRALFILGQTYKPSSWRDVFEFTMNTIAEFEPDKFDEIINQFPSFVGKDKRKFKMPRELKNGAFIEVDHLSARSTIRLCYQALETIGLTIEDWEVETA